MPACEVRGRIFDVRRFSTHDGVGIRTSVFFQGCGLRCAWCQNPEGLSSAPGPIRFASRCVHCGTCAALARHGGAKMADGDVVIDRTADEDWAKLIDACPTGALRMDAREVTVSELMPELMADQVFFRHGGGVTLTGGDPMMQPSFALALLQALGERGVHRAIETSLFGPEGALERIAPEVDQFFADVKLIDPGAHRKWTGQDNAGILRRVRWLMTNGFADRLTVRTPLIPGITATGENLGGIARFLSGICPEIRWELLNYNPLAEAKYHLVDRKYCFEDNPEPFTDGELRAFADIGRGNGLRNIILDIN